MSDTVEILEKHDGFDEPKFDLPRMLDEIKLEGGVKHIGGDVKQTDITKMFKRNPKQR